MPELVTLQHVKAAMHRLEGHVEHTPLLPSGSLSALTGCQIYLKAENLQKTGSFKVRGAMNKMAQMPAAERQRGVVAASAGNHAQGVAMAGARLGIRATIVMPEPAPLTKVVSTRALGAEVVLAGANYDGAYERALDIQQERGLVFVHAFDDPDVIAGQGTLAPEILAAIPDLDAILVPVGGGGLISGIAVAAKSIRPALQIIGVQAAGAQAIYRSRLAGRLVDLPEVRTIADGLAVKHPRAMTFDLIQRYVDDVVVVAEDDIAWAILLFLERAKLVVEGAGAVGLAALLGGQVSLPEKKVALVVSGGNIDVNILARIIDRGLAKEGRYVRLATRLADQPGALERVLHVVAQRRGNVISVEHDRLQPGVPLGETEVRLLLEARDQSHVQEMITALEDEGYPVTFLQP